MLPSAGSKNRNGGVNQGAARRAASAAPRKRSQSRKSQQQRGAHPPAAQQQQHQQQQQRNVPRAGGSASYLDTAGGIKQLPTASNGRQTAMKKTAVSGSNKGGNGNAPRRRGASVAPAPSSSVAGGSGGGSGSKSNTGGNSVNQGSWILLRMNNCVVSKEKIRIYFGYFFGELRIKHGFSRFSMEPSQELGAATQDAAVKAVRSAIAGGRNSSGGLLMVICRDDEMDAIKERLKKHFDQQLRVFCLKLSEVVGVADGRITPAYTAKFFAKCMSGGSSSSNNEERKQPHSGMADSKNSCYPIGYDRIESLHAELEAGRHLHGSSDLLVAALDSAFIRRLDDLWPQEARQAKFLHIVVAVAADAERVEQRQLAHEFLQQVFSSGFVQKLVESYLARPDKLLDAWRRSPVVMVHLVADFLQLLLLGLQILPSSMERHLDRCFNIISTLRSDSLRTHNFLTEECEHQLDLLNQVFTARVEGKDKQDGRADGQVAGPNKRPTFEGSQGAPPEDYRQLRIIPTRDDLLIAPEAVYLRAAKKQGRYDDDEHYLDVQFRLLREDLVRPLRDGIRELRALAQRCNKGHKDQQQRTDLFVYRMVVLQQPQLEMISGQMLAYADLSKGFGKRQIRWNKRLVYGSLVCLSRDGFCDDFHFAMVSDRDERQLAKGRIGLYLERMDGVEFGEGAQYSMVESPAFFEAYRHVMEAMKAIPPGERLPFSRYLVEVNTEVQPPAYLATLPRFDFFPLVLAERKRQTAEPPATARSFVVDVTRLGAMNNNIGDGGEEEEAGGEAGGNLLSAEDLGMDASQFDALRYALTTELAIIQGPPGTGKTYLGLQLVKLLFANEDKWNCRIAGQQPAATAALARRVLMFRQGAMANMEDRRPMLVVCYTNHALDQFLEGMLPFMSEGIIRIGGRCKNPKLEQFTINNVRLKHVAVGEDTRARQLRKRLYDERCRLRSVNDGITVLHREEGQYSGHAYVKAGSIRFALRDLRFARLMRTQLQVTTLAPGRHRDKGGDSGGDDSDREEGLEEFGYAALAAYHEQIRLTEQCLSTIEGHTPAQRNLGGHQAKKGRVLESSLSFISWLTDSNSDAQTSDTQPIVRMDAITITELMQLAGAHVNELTAKRAVYCHYARTGFAPPAHELFQRLMQPGMLQALHHYFDQVNPQGAEQVARWPAVADVWRLVNQHGVNCDVAMELLTSCGPTRPAVARVFDFFRHHYRRGVKLPPWFAVQEDDGDQMKEGEGETDAMPEEQGIDAEELAMALREDEERKVVDDYGDEELENGEAPLPYANKPNGSEGSFVGEAIVEDNPEIRGFYEAMAVQEENEQLFQQECWSDRLRTFAPYICSAPPMREAEAREAMANPKALRLHDRWRLYTYWVALARQLVRERLATLERAYGVLTRRIRELRQLVNVDILRSAKVIGMTTTGAAMHQAALKALRPRVVVVEEAAEVLEAHILTSVTQACEHLILIGDHQQLRPNPAVYELARRYNLEISLFERLINNGYPYRALRLQHRMRPEISRTLMPHFYPALKDAPSVASYPHVDGMRTNFHFFTHHWPECAIDASLGGRSHSNKEEALFALRLANYLRQQEQYEAGEITILCTYLEQLLKLRRMADEVLGRQHGMRIENVDNYQGEESKIIVLSLVRSTLPGRADVEEEQRRSPIGYLSVANRVCVAMSRAQHGFYIIGNADHLAANSELWANIRASANAAGALSPSLPVRCQMHGNEQEMASAEDFHAKCREGGCQLPCDGRMDCGHTCQMPCHPYEHKKVMCMKPCARRCKTASLGGGRVEEGELALNGVEEEDLAPNEGHPCEKLCYLKCGNCMAEVMRTLPCKHKRKSKCHEDVSKLQCEMPCRKLLRCGHLCPKRCAQECPTYCTTKVAKTLSCWHTAQLDCSADPASVQCKTRVVKEWPLCGHSCETSCSTDVREELCPHPCGQPLPDCEHPCKGTCGQCRNGRLHLRCTQNCERILVCGHKCQSKCAKACPPCERPCETACGHSCCGQGAVEKKKLRQAVYDNEKSQGGEKKGKGKKKNGRLCGQPCPVCAEKCLNKCEHRACANPCWAPCSVKPCQESCGKPLCCSPKLLGKIRGEPVEGPAERPHLCIGVCGELCPKLCAICQPEEFAELKEVFFGYEDEEDARFVLLPDCGHLVEAKGLDNWIDQLVGANTDESVTQATSEDASSPTASNNEEGNTSATNSSSQAIVTITCPKCKTPIRRSQRYISLLNERAADINSIKYKLLGGSKQVLDRQWHELQKRFGEHTAGLGGQTDFSNHLDQLRSIFLDEKEQQQHQLNSQWLTSAGNVVAITGQLVQRYKELIEGKFSTDLRSVLNPSQLQQQLPSNVRRVLQRWMPLKPASSHSNLVVELFSNHLKAELTGLLGRLAIGSSAKLLPSDAVFNQLGDEVARYDLLVNLISYLCRLIAAKIDIDSVGEALLTSILKHFHGSAQFDVEQTGTVTSLIKKLADYHKVEYTLSDQERISIVKALSGQVNKWYKCSQGHLYGIGDCGQAMVTSRCPECGEAIGGGSHRLVDTNREAPEMTRGMHIPPPPDPFQVIY